jgi:hypothetical protein
MRRRSTDMDQEEAMRSRCRAPALGNPNIVIRLARNSAEVERTNALVCGNYVEEGYWDDDQPFRSNPHMFSSQRIVFVATCDDHLLATASIVRDSPEGLPVDKFQSPAITTFRAGGQRLAEVSALAVQKDCAEQRSLVLFLFKFVYQYSFYYARVDRFLIATTTRHAPFYKSVYCFDELPVNQDYNYAKPPFRLTLLTLPLLEAHQRFFERYETGLTQRDEGFYRFMLVNEHPNLEFPEKRLMQRQRQVDWLGQSLRGQLARAG